MTGTRSFLRLLAGVFIFGAPAVAAAEVTVRFAAIEKYVDAGASEGERARNLAVIERHIRAAAQRCVGADGRLDVEVLDVDLAGEVDWSRSAALEQRSLRDETPPRLEIAFKLLDATGTMRGEVRDRLVDMDYLRRGARERFAREALPYERAMLEDWVARRLCPLPR
ncbi:MAG: DUF3016 domain-containing protein [Planctomycetes bacterium]|nr:DUF3016 domain-containing protein [Planctomycetota bacterium]MCB1947303.1 DUF3016 domain-containing protein [Thauera sp.]